MAMWKKMWTQEHLHYNNWFALLNKLVICTDWEKKENSSNQFDYRYYRGEWGSPITDG